jgi:hypothetical protein
MSPGWPYITSRRRRTTVATRKGSPKRRAPYDRGHPRAARLDEGRRSLEERRTQSWPTCRERTVARQDTTKPWSYGVRRDDPGNPTYIYLPRPPELTRGDTLDR